MKNEDYQIIFHEIKNSITFLNSSLQLIEKQHPEIKAFSYWNDSLQEISSLKKLLIELSSARLSNDLCLQKVSPKQFLPQLVSNCLTLLDSNLFFCNVELEPSLPDIEIDCDRIKRVFFNLMKNSCEAMNGSGTIRLSARLEDSFLRLDLTDFGGGIPPEYLPKIFTPLATTKHDGTGLGLLISRQIVEAHNGSLTVDSRYGDGCTFSVCLPCVKTGA